MGRSPGFGSTPTDFTALLRLGFPSAPYLKYLTSPVSVTRRTVLQKVRGCTYKVLPQLVNTGFQVLFHSPPGVLFTVPSQYYALSVTKEYLALGGGPPDFRQGSTCLVLLRIPPAPLRFRIRGFHPLWLAFPIPFFYPPGHFLRSITPDCTHSGLGSFHFARRYFGNRCFFLFLRLLRCFSSPGSPCMAMDSPYSDWSFSSRVSPFRNLRVIGYLLLTAAFRSLSRLSSALSAKASTLRSYQLNHYPLKMHLYQMICVKRLHLSTFPKAGRIALRPWSVEFLLLNKIVSYSVFRFASFDAPRMS